jgi:hypothetical protein
MKLQTGINGEYDKDLVLVKLASMFLIVLIA